MAAGAKDDDASSKEAFVEGGGPYRRGCHCRAGCRGGAAEGKSVGGAKGMIGYTLEYGSMHMEGLDTSFEEEEGGGRRPRAKGNAVGGGGAERQFCAFAKHKANKTQRLKSFFYIPPFLFFISSSPALPPRRCSPTRSLPASLCTATRGSYSAPKYPPPSSLSACPAAPFAPYCCRHASP